ncbi:placenta-expressed transcript 1 protein-like [Phaenicophaeus curvirostris]|uniref:placenta-expressed transcript 1 protein-like n=1 Tax=Phaenicophaeus curvirostris TaxID=33595 RepID=UPI0037F0E488
MATFLFLVQLLFIGTHIIPASAQTETCNWLQTTTESNFTINVTSDVYQANTTYLVTIIDNLPEENVTNYLLQALSPQKASLGNWSVEEIENCSSINTAVLKSNQKAANWTSPESNITSVEIRAYIRLKDSSTLFSTKTLRKEAKTTTAPSATTPNSVSMVQSSSFFIAVIQLPLLLITSKLLS